MTVRLTMLCATAADGGHDRILGEGAPGAPVTAAVPPYALALRGPSARCARTAEALGIDAAPRHALRGLDHGAWEGRPLADVAAEDPHGLSVWLTDPDAAPPAGESVRRFCRRTADWLTVLPAGPEPVLAIVEESVVRAALVHALALPARAFRYLDVPSVLTLTLRDDGWSARLAPPAAPRHRRPADGPGTVAVPTLPATRRHLCLTGRP
ncbi:histidine phosphatase family protein [Streptomyces sp. NRRL B-3648]|uniref:histidine phosphatase family protein n=1 Tax=Streptomyces sp. NRRL B-3648 TaxID=1519493 RepID=UPI0006B06C91|nr:histidine phosphatase family protein [Streptomyces sp. NRRL B-3648]